MSLAIWRGLLPLFRILHLGLLCAQRASLNPIADQHFHASRTHTANSTMPTPRPKPDDYQARDVAILHATHRYGIALSESISALFFGQGKPCGHVLRRLEARGLLEIHSRSLPGGHSYGTLTSRGLRDIGVDKQTVKAMGPTALNAAIAIAWYCTLQKTRRYRLLSSEISEQFPEPNLGNVPHVLTDEFEFPVVLRVYQAFGKPSASRRYVEEFISRTRTQKGLAEAFASGTYGLLVLCPTEAKANQLRLSFDKKPPSTSVRVVISHGPTAETLASSLRERKRETNE